MTVYSPEGWFNIVVGEAGLGVYNPDGHIRCTDATAETDYVGRYAADGSWNVTILVSEATRVPLHAPNGSVNVIQGSASTGIYSPCGAWNVQIN